ncbi:hypothetical protein [Streptomyces sp. NPDC006289]|uniref:hypothetical protein n=1 Tax=Streptomyces sp. NPDC006289 TaxID=3156744 RepID=UPI0033A91F76
MEDVEVRGGERHRPLVGVVQQDTQSPDHLRPAGFPGAGSGAVQFARSSWLRGSSRGRYADMALSKSRLSAPTRNTTTHSTAMLSRSSQKSTGIASTSTLRARLATSRMRRRSYRSAHTPADSPRSSTAADSAASRTPICQGVAARVVTAMMPMAMKVISVPAGEMVSPVQGAGIRCP